MKTFSRFLAVAALGGLLACGSLMADSIQVLGGLPDGDTDTISIAFDPVLGAVDGVAGASVGWGFTVIWTSTDNDWVSFTGTSLGSVEQQQTNPALTASYTDFIGFEGGPSDFALAPGSWSQTFDGVSQGVGLYQISSDPGVAITGAQDTGQITFYFQVYSGDPLIDGVQIGEASYSYYGPSTAYSVTVDAPVEGTAPEPGTWFLLAGGVAALLLARKGIGKAGAVTEAQAAYHRVRSTLFHRYGPRNSPHPRTTH